MVDFCPECSNLLRKDISNGKPCLKCRCGYTQECEEDSDNTEVDLEKKMEVLDQNVIIVSQDDKTSVHPTVLVECPKCKHNEAEAWQEQTRSADEPSTSFFRCTKCRFTWREY